MIVLVSTESTSAQVNAISGYFAMRGIAAARSELAGYTAFDISDSENVLPEADVRAIPGVVDVVRTASPYRLAAREHKPEGTRVEVGKVTVGGKDIVLAAGPCAAESEEQVLAAAAIARKAGARILRGGAFKPRSSPYYFQGAQEEGLRALRKAANEFGMPLVTEVMGVDLIDTVGEYADVFQVGSRNMDNYHLLKKLATAGKPVLLKRGMAATVEEFLLAAEYLLSGGNPDVILCERGIRTYSGVSRYTLDIAAIAELKKLTHLPVICDPSHAAGKRSLVAPLAAGAIASGADGLIIEVHAEPECALCDGYQSLSPPELAELSDISVRVAAAVGRTLAM